MLCLDLVVENALPFRVFDSSGMTQLVRAAASHHKEAVTVNASNMKLLVLEEAETLKRNFKKVLANRFVNLQIDMATCQAQSFFGKKNIITLRSFAI